MFKASVFKASVLDSLLAVGRLPSNRDEKLAAARVCLDFFLSRGTDWAVSNRRSYVSSFVLLAGAFLLVFGVVAGFAGVWWLAPAGVCGLVFFGGFWLLSRKQGPFSRREVGVSAWVASTGDRAWRPIASRDEVADALALAACLKVFRFDHVSGWLNVFLPADLRDPFLPGASGSGGVHLASARLLCQRVHAKDGQESLVVSQFYGLLCDVTFSEYAPLLERVLGSFKPWSAVFRSGVHASLGEFEACVYVVSGTLGVLKTRQHAVLLEGLLDSVSDFDAKAFDSMVASVELLVV